MNTFLQIAIALSPVLLLFVLLSVFAKKGKALNIVISALAGCVIIGAVVCNFAIKPERVRKDDEEIISEEKAVEQIDIIYSIAANTGDYEYALELLKELRGSSYDNSELTLCEAYLNGALGNWKNAMVLYNKAIELGGAEDPNFAQYCTLALEQSKIDYAASDYRDIPDSPATAIEDLKTHSKDTIVGKTTSLEEETASVARVIAESKKVFDDYLSDGTVDQTVVSDLVSSLNRAVSKNSGLLRMDEVRICRAKLLVLAGKYSEIAKNIDDDSIYEELAIASELSINGLIKDKDFEKYSDKYKDKVEAVCDQLDELRDELDNDEEEALVGTLIDKLEADLDPSALDILEDGITAKTLDDNFTDKPKAHIQLAKISYEKDDEDKAKDHISSALNSLGVCEDEEFYVPLGEIARVINDKDSGSDLKNVATYVDDVLNSTSDKVVVSAVEKAQDEIINNGGNIGNEQGSVEDEKNTSFDSFMGDAISQMRISVNITNVNVDNFSQVTATVNFDDSLSVSAEELKEMITVTDCGVEITDFTVEKVEYKAANILLCCDGSGSMSGTPMDDLIAAVKKFIQTSSDKENIALVAFASDVTEVYDFGTDKSVLINAADGLYDGGGTNMYDAVIESIQKFKVRDGELNFILLLSDGEDNDYHSVDEINRNIGEACLDRQIILYSLGLGYSVNIDYMDALATSTNGAFVYVADSATVEDFYNNLRNQLLNQYYITFTAKDTLTVNRTLKIQMTDDSLAQDTADYSLDRDEEGSVTENESGEAIITYGDKGVYGLDTSLVFKSKLSTVVNVKGFGFSEDDSFTAELDGKLDYSNGSVKCEYVDANTIKLTLPGGIACGKYDVRVSVGDMMANIKDGITVVTQGSEKTVAFGPYVFTSYEKTVNGDSTTLSGMVNLNGWLTFKGDVVLTKHSYDERRMELTDNYGSYITYHTDTAEGLAKVMANTNTKLSVPALGNVTLVNDALKNAEADDYPVNPVYVGPFYFTDALAYEAPGLSLYPNRFELTSNEFTTKLPMQDKLLKSAGYKDIFNFELEITGIITNKTIGVTGSFSNQPEDMDSYSPVNFGAAPIYLSPAKYTVKIDTVKNEYSIDFAIKVAFINNDGIGFFVEWKERETDTGFQKLWPNEVLLKCDYPIKATIGPVPVTYSDFKLGLSDIDPNKNILDWKLKGQFTLATSKLSDFVPGLTEYLDDPAMLSLKDTTIEFSLGQCYFGVSTELKLLDEITLGKAKIEAGKISVNSVLLGFEGRSAKGMRAELSRGIEWHLDNCDFEAMGTGIIHMHDQFVGVELDAKLDVDIKWYIFKVADFSAEGMGAIGVQFDDGLPTFVIKVAKQDRDGYEGYYLIWNERTSLDYGKLEV